MPGPGPYPGWQYPIPAPSMAAPVSVTPRESAPSQLGVADPLGKEARVGWQQTALPLMFTLTPAPIQGVVGWAIWQTPIFDLRLDLGLQFSGDPAYAQPIPRGAVFGSGGTLFLQVHGVDALKNANLEMAVASVEYGHVFNPVYAETRQLCEPDFGPTSDLYDGGTDAVLTFSPPSGPLKYWRQRVVFYLLSGTLAQVNGLLTTEAAMY